MEDSLIQVKEPVCFINLQLTIRIHFLALQGQGLEFIVSLREINVASLFLYSLQKRLKKQKILSEESFKISSKENNSYLLPEGR